MENKLAVIKSNHIRPSMSGATLDALKGYAVVMDEEFQTEVYNPLLKKGNFYAGTGMFTCHGLDSSEFGYEIIHTLANYADKITNKNIAFSSIDEIYANAIHCIRTAETDIILQVKDEKEIVLGFYLVKENAKEGSSDLEDQICCATLQWMAESSIWYLSSTTYDESPLFSEGTIILQKKKTANIFCLAYVDVQITNVMSLPVDIALTKESDKTLFTKLQVTEIVRQTMPAEEKRPFFKFTGFDLGAENPEESYVDGLIILEGDGVHRFVYVQSRGFDDETSDSSIYQTEFTGEMGKL